MKRCKEFPQHGSSRYIRSRVMKSRNKIIRWRNKFPLMRPIDMAHKLNVSKQYVHKILKKYDLPTSAPRPRKLTYCLVCRELLLVVKRFCSNKCRYEYYNIIVTCSFCKFKFIRKRHLIVYKYKLGYTNIYCSRKCLVHAQREGKNATKVLD